MNKLLANIFCCIFILVGFSSAAFARSNITYQDEGAKAFTLKQKFKVYQQKYQDVFIEQFEPAARDINDGADRQVVRFLSAVVKDDINWWKSTWTIQSQQDWQDKVMLNKTSRLFNFWKARVNSKTKVQLVDFIVAQQTVLVGFRLINQDTEYHLLALVLENSRWRVDQGFMETELYQQIKKSVQS